MSHVNVVSATTGEVFDLGPIKVRVLEDGKLTDNRIGAVEITVPPHTDQTPQHLHKMHDEMFLVTKGTLRFTVGDAHHDVAAGGLVVVPPEAPHTFSNPFDETAVFFNTFTPAFYVDYLRDLSRLAASGEGLSPQNILKVMSHYATLPT